MVISATILATLSKVGAVLEVVSGVAKTVREVRETWEDVSRALARRVPTQVRDNAMAATLQEWEQVAVSVDPQIASWLRPNSELSIRASSLEKAAAHFAAVDARSSLPPNTIRLEHTYVGKNANGECLVRMGESDETKVLEGISISVHEGRVCRMTIPRFKVTMLGGEGSGKTVFMAAMYAVLSLGKDGISIRAADDRTSVELVNSMTNLYEHGKWPGGTRDVQRNYLFELLVGGRHVIDIDWVDYRGGALDEGPDSDAGQALLERVRDSHAVLWMLDLSRIGSRSLLGVGALTRTKVLRMATICKNAVRGSDSSRVWVFVRTKADGVGSGPMQATELEFAVSQLVEHLGACPTEVARNEYGSFSRAVAIAVSAAGRVGTDNAFLGEDPVNVEWPLLLSLSYLMELEAKRTEITRNDKFRQYEQAGGGVSGWVRDALSLGPNEAQRRLSGEMLDAHHQLWHIHHTIARLQDNMPRNVRILR